MLEHQNKLISNQENKIIMKTKERVMWFVLAVISPYVGFQFMVTESCAEFLWWETVLGFIITIFVYSVYVRFWYDKLFHNIE